MYDGSDLVLRLRPVLSLSALAIRAGYGTDRLYSCHYHTVRFLHYLRMSILTALFRLTSTPTLQRHGRS